MLPVHTKSMSLGDLVEALTIVRVFWGGLAIQKKIAGKCRRPFSDPPGDLIDRWEHRDGRGRAPRANGSDIPFSAKRPISRGGKGVKGVVAQQQPIATPHLEP